jgi:quercetin dioxygenase-like cupin family protein
LEVEGAKTELQEGNAIFVPAGADHRFSGYEQLSVLVVFERKPS